MIKYDIFVGRNLTKLNYIFLQTYTHIHTYIHTREQNILKVCNKMITVAVLGKKTELSDDIQK